MKAVKIFLFGLSLVLVGQTVKPMDAQKKAAEQKAEAQKKIQELEKKKQAAQEAQDALKKEQEELKKLQASQAKDDTLIKKQAEVDAKLKEFEQKKQDYKDFKSTDAGKAAKQMRDFQKMLQDFSGMKNPDDQKAYLGQILTTLKDSDDLINMIKNDKEFAKNFRGTVSKMFDGLGEKAKTSVGQYFKLEGPHSTKNLFRGFMGLAGLGGVAGLFFGDDFDALGLGGQGTDVDVNVNLGDQEQAQEKKSTKEALSDFWQDSKKIVGGALSEKGKELAKKLSEKVDTIEQNLLFAASETLKRVTDSAGVVAILGNRLLSEITDDMQTKIEGVFKDPKTLRSSAKDITQKLEAELKPELEKLKSDVTEILKAARTGRKAYVSDKDMNSALDQTASDVKDQYKKYFSTLYQSLLVKLNLADNDDAKEKIKQSLRENADKAVEAVDQAVALEEKAAQEERKKQTAKKSDKQPQFKEELDYGFDAEDLFGSNE